MYTDDLKPYQTERIEAQVFRQLQYINRLIVRMKSRCFPHNDQMAMAQDGLTWLLNATHSASYKMGAGNDPDAAISSIGKPRATRLCR